MEFLKDRRIVLAIGGGAALLLGVLIAMAFVHGDNGPKAPPPASEGGLVVTTGRDDDAKLDPTRPIRCFVDGQFAGEITLTECAKRNGVATDALDVGTDETGALAAASEAGTILAPLPPQASPQTPPAQAETPNSQPSQPQAAAATCWRYAGGSWSQAGSMDLNACVQTLYAGRCEPRGAASYGRWGDQTLRLVHDRIEISSDNRRFRTLVEQGSGCSIPPVG